MTARLKIWDVKQRGLMVHILVRPGIGISCVSVQDEKRTLKSEYFEIEFGLQNFP